MVMGRRQPKQLYVGRVGDPSYGVPVSIFQRSPCPGERTPGESFFDMPVFCYVVTVVETDKRVLQDWQVHAPSDDRYSDCGDRNSSAAPSLRRLKQGSGATILAPLVVFSRITPCSVHR